MALFSNSYLSMSFIILKGITASNTSKWKLQFHIFHFPILQATTILLNRQELASCNSLLSTLDQKIYIPVQVEHLSIYSFGTPARLERKEKEPATFKNNTSLRRYFTQFHISLVVLRKKKIRNSPCGQLKAINKKHV